MSNAMTVDNPGCNRAKFAPEIKESFTMSNTTEGCFPVSADIDAKTQTLEEGMKVPKSFDEAIVREIIIERVKNTSYKSRYNFAVERVRSGVHNNMQETTALMAYVENFEETVAYFRNQAAALHSITRNPVFGPTNDNSSVLSRAGT